MGCVLLIDEGVRVARKKHQCFDCYRPIYPGEEYYHATCTYEGQIYSIKQHTDCRAASEFYRKFIEFDVWSFDMDGIPPLADMISDGGEFVSDMDLLRGRFPHVVARMEYRDQIAAIRFNEWSMPQ